MSTSNESSDGESTDSNENHGVIVAAPAAFNEYDSSNEVLSDESDGGISDSNETSDENAHNFDLNLPTAHSYLGNNLEELRGRTLLDEGIYMNLPLFVEKCIILFPGQTLPLTIFGTSLIEMLEQCIQKDRTFGVVASHDDKLDPIGTTAEIYEFMHGTPEQGGFRIKAKGRQRFKIIRISQKYNQISANVRIIPEVVLPFPPFFEQRLLSLNHHRVGLQDAFKSDKAQKNEKVERMESIITPWPNWVYKQYDPNRLAHKVRNYLQIIETKGSYIPTDPSDLSFWVAQNLPLTDNERITLLRYDSAISRLQWELKYLTKDRILVCLQCGKILGKHCDIFPMSREGPTSTFCNPSGYTHDTLTLYHAKNIRLSDDPPTAEYSWFPGYCWTIATCSNCNCHLGWKFTAGEDKSLRPQSFWGLTRKALKSVKSVPRKSSQTSQHSSGSISDSN